MSFHENQLMVFIGGLGFVFGFLGFPYEREVIMQKKPKSQTPTTNPNHHFTTN